MLATDGIGILVISLRKYFIFHDEVFDVFDKAFIDVDDNVTVHMAAVVAATIDITAQETTVGIIVHPVISSNWHEILLCSIPLDGVPLQFHAFLR